MKVPRITFLPLNRQGKSMASPITLIQALRCVAQHPSPPPPPPTIFGKPDLVEPDQSPNPRGAVVEPPNSPSHSPTRRKFFPRSCHRPALYILSRPCRASQPSSVCRLRGF